MIATVVYGLCTLTSTLCAAALYVQYRRNRVRLLYWSAMCFVGFALNNLLLSIDYSLGPSVNLAVVRTIPSFLGVGIMVCAFIWELI